MVLINLLPWREQRREQMKQQFLALLILVAAAAIIIMICSHSVFSVQLSQEHRDNSFLQQEIQILDKKIAETIEIAADEVIAGKLDDHFPLVY